MDSPLRIARETEFYQGYIRFKMSVSNESPHLIGDITVELIFDDKLLYIAEHDDYPIQNGKFVIGNIYGSKSKSITILFEPLTCSKATDIKCQINYTDHEGKMASTFMVPKEITVVCPIMKTDQDINIGRLKEFIENLPNCDSRVYQVQSNFDIKKLATLAREVVEKHDVRHIRTLHTRDNKTCEIWYYGRTKVTKDDIVIKISILAESHTMELFSATRSAETLTGLLAEIGRDLKKIVESKANGRVVNVHIKDSVVQRSNLLDMCDMDGSCNVDVVIEDSVVQHTNIATVNEEEQLKKEQEKQEEATPLKPAEENNNKKQEEEKRQEQSTEKKSPEKKHKARKTTYVSYSKQSSTSTDSQSLSPKKKPSKSKALIPMFVLLLLGVILIGLMGNTDNSQDTVSLQNPVNIEDKEDSTNPNSENYTNSIGMEFVLIPAGDFEMGSPSDEDFRDDDESPVHKVTIEKAYYLGKYEVTQEQWVEVMGSNPSRFIGDDRPVESISWSDVQEFIKKLNEMEGTDKYRLPSEAEWEYACRADTTTSYFFGENTFILTEYAWYYKNSEDTTHPVGKKKLTHGDCMIFMGMSKKWFRINTILTMKVLQVMVVLGKTVVTLMESYAVVAGTATPVTVGRLIA